MGFSNFFNASWCGAFDFRIPLVFCQFDLSEEERTTSCECSERAVMLCKAAVFGDFVSYRKIQQETHGRPDLVKALGRKVDGFDADVWELHVCSVAFHVVYQKFSK